MLKGIRRRGAKMLAMPRAKQRKMHRTPVLHGDQNQQQKSPKYDEI